MDQNKLLECVEFFNKLKIIEEDVTTDIERTQGYLVVIVTYEFEGKSYQTKKLFYKDISLQGDVHGLSRLQSYFKTPVYWLDIVKHNWPHGKGAEIEKTVIKDMFDGDNPDFEKLLKLIANNKSTGFIQEITWEGRTQMYGHNFENNNHWHDLVRLIQYVIKNKGELPPKEYFSRLVFKWHKDGRDSLSPDLGGRKMIWDFIKNIKTIQTQLSKMELSKILLNKKQIILQGPPGTGKTFTAKQLAEQLTGSNNVELTSNEIKKILKVGIQIPNASGVQNYYTIKDISETNVTLTSERATQDWIPAFNQIQIKYNQLANGEEPENKNGLHPYELAVAKYLFEKLEQSLKKNNRYQLIQFHPSYTYEDFVRGITAKSNDGVIEYITEDKILAKFAKKALKNFNDSKKEQLEVSKEKWIIEQFEKFLDLISDDLEKNGKIEITKAVNIIKLDENAFRYKGLIGWSENGNRMLFEDIKQAYLDGNIDRQDVKHNQNLSGLANHHASYYIRVLDQFKKFLKDNNLVFVANISEKEELKNFVLIIDEINRANLPSVLGELIYALEYRGEKVESMYEIDGDNSLIIPPNLYIIGTMNTADRSVGHIDYAIRRRFAFVDILPNASVIKNASAKALFEEISNLFHSNDTLASDFKPAQVQLGHSYFIVNDDVELQLKAKYEIVPILEEYLKDGILLEKAEKIILELKQRFDN
ncbi:MAG: AAA family ATPase [Bacteroidota bacterium]